MRGTSDQEQGNIELVDDIVQARFAATLPVGKWLSTFSRAYHDLAFQVLSMLKLEDGTGNVMFQVEGIHVAQFLEEFTLACPVKSFNVLHESPGLALINVIMDEPLLVSAFVETTVPVKYPIFITGGKAVVDIVAPRTSIDNLLGLLERAGFVPRLFRIGPYDGEPVLPPRYREVLDVALSAGYFEVPRRLSMKDLAARLGMSTSTLSETMRRIFKKLASRYIQGVQAGAFMPIAGTGTTARARTRR